ncbi:MAG: hypothetical protein ACJAWV_004118 [Flammeovirgaceae bacterium]|jgi:hypothetical protein
MKKILLLLVLFTAFSCDDESSNEPDLIDKYELVGT